MQDDNAKSGAPEALGSEIVDVAIVGSGAAGAYAAYRLSRADPRQSELLRAMLARSGRDRLEVRVFDSSDRVGGRLWTHHFAETPGVPADLGAQGFSKIQQNVFGLCHDELKLAMEPFEPYNRQDIQFLRRHQFWPADYADPNKVPYYLTENQRGKDPATLFTAAVCTAIPGFSERLRAAAAAVQAGNLTEAFPVIYEMTRFLQSARSARGHLPLTAQGLWNALLPYLNIEGYSLSLGASFTHTFFGNFNFYDQVNTYFTQGLAYSMPAGEPPFWHLMAGYQSLASTLLARSGYAVHRGHRLNNLQRVSHGHEPLVRLTFLSANREVRVLARHIILALPPRALELLDPGNMLNSSATFRTDIRSVFGNPATTIHLTFDRAWWVDPARPGHFLQGYSVSDYPLRTCYYIGRSKNGAGLINSLTDATGTLFWLGLDEQGSMGPLAAPLLAELDARQPASQLEQPLRPSPAMAEELRAQLELMHEGIVLPPGERIPAPSNGAFVNWAANPYGGGWHYWNANLKSWEVMPRIRRPLSDQNIFICGEAFSAVQGWAEGALNTAERVLQQYFGLRRPDWVVPTYDFGP